AGPVPYPRPGRANVEVKLAVVAAKGGKPTIVDWDRARYPYLTQVAWQEGGPLTVLVMTRDQRDLVALAADAKTGKTHELLHEQADVFLNVTPMSWLADGSGFLWASERGGAWQLELHAADGKLVRVLTAPELGYKSLEHIDLQRQALVVAAAAEPVDR